MLFSYKIHYTRWVGHPHYSVDCQLRGCSFIRHSMYSGEGAAGISDVRPIGCQLGSNGSELPEFRRCEPVLDAGLDPAARADFKDGGRSAQTATRNTTLEVAVLAE